MTMTSSESRTGDIAPRPSTGVTFGVEEEFLLVDTTGQLAPAGSSVLDSSPAGAGELQREMVRCQVESATPVCEHAEELLAHLHRLRAQLSTGARRHGLLLLASGTPPLAGPRGEPLTSDHRYRRIARHYRALTNTANVCGCHVHVAVPDQETGVQLSNHLRPWLPVLLAASANSPFIAGADSGYASWRHQLMSQWPSGGPPPYFESLDHHDSAVDALARSGAVLDPATVYWDVRLSPRHPTLEVRVCDVVSTVEDAALIAVLVRSLAIAACQRIADGDRAIRVPHEILRADLWRAARDGLAGQCAAPAGGRLMPARVALCHLVDQIRPILRAMGEEEFVDSGVRRLLLGGDGAQRQRAAYRRQGNMRDVIDTLANQTMR